VSNSKNINYIHEQNLIKIKFEKFFLPFISESFFLLLYNLKKVKSKTCETVILPADLYARETFSLAPREEHRLRISQKGSEKNI
jgi:hypothetical protein